MGLNEYMKNLSATERTEIFELIQFFEIINGILKLNDLNSINENFKCKTLSELMHFFVENTTFVISESTRHNFYKIRPHVEKNMKEILEYISSFNFDSIELDNNNLKTINDISSLLINSNQIIADRGKDLDNYQQQFGSDKKSTADCLFIYNNQYYPISMKWITKGQLGKVGNYLSVLINDYKNQKIKLSYDTIKNEFLNNLTSLNFPLYFTSNNNGVDINYFQNLLESQKMEKYKFSYYNNSNPGNVKNVNIDSENKSKEVLIKSNYLFEYFLSEISYLKELLYHAVSGGDKNVSVYDKSKMRIYSTSEFIDNIINNTTYIQSLRIGLNPKYIIDNRNSTIVSKEHLNKFATWSMNFTLTLNTNGKEHIFGIRNDTNSTSMSLNFEISSYKPPKD